MIQPQMSTVLRLRNPEVNHVLFALGSVSLWISQIPWDDVCFTLCFVYLLRALGELKGQSQEGALLGAMGLWPHSCCGAGVRVGLLSRLSGEVEEEENNLGNKGAGLA